MYRVPDPNFTLLTYEQLLPEDVAYAAWEREEVPYRGTVLKMTRLHQNVHSTKDEFLTMFTREFEALREHVKRMASQFAAIRHLRQNLEPQRSITVQIDYAENYACAYQDEPAQVCYDRHQVTIHPMVVHYHKDEESDPVHESFVGVSQVTNHSAPTSVAFLLQLLEHLAVKFPVAA